MKKLFLTALLITGGLAATAQTANTAPASKNTTEDRDLPNSVQNTTGSRNILKLYPNPTLGGITIEGFVVNFTADYAIADLTGKQVMSGTISSDNHKLDVSKLLNGMYIITIKEDKETTVLRFVKQ